MTDKPLWKKPWIWIPATVAGVAGVLTGTISILANARVLPSEWQKTSDQFLGWYHDDRAWKGKWINNPEGYADIADMALSNNPISINIDDAQNGHLVGSISSRGICDKVPFFAELMIEGSVSGSKYANIIVWDLIGGHKTEFARLKISRDDYIMTVTPSDDPSKLFSNSYRIARDPNEISGSDSSGICQNKLSDTIKSISDIQNTRK